MNLATDRLNGIAVFVQAAEAGSFALAGQRLGLTRSAVGKTVARLEERLGTRLFQRTTRSQSLTDDGQAFHERCVRALAELEAAQAELESGRSEPVGRLRVSMPVLFGRCCVAPLLVELARRHAGLSLELSFNDRPVDMVAEGFDLAVRIGDVPDSADLVARPLGKDTMVLCAAPSYLRAHGQPRRLADLAAHHCMAYSVGGAAKPLRILDAQGRAVTVPIASRVLMDDLEAMANAAVAGAGLVALPCWLVGERVRTGVLKRLLARHTIANHAVRLLWPRTRQLPFRVRTAIDMLAERVPPLLSVRLAQPAPRAGAARAGRG
ncbi:LysR family transcriptional regulator [Ramlibacter sp.]|uniref:LysR family transcriptional regulator n=1 Tax=Ramlibacter sp. TaxID=1917967 RepID=UPI00185969F8|nr:LysR family transcriptional regulator [Ramlibacter sp.]MBA2673320.1 LysR family transcriptional regulator [Ramlibacter sp.]